MASSSSPARPNLGPLTTTFTPPATCSIVGVVPDDRTYGWRGCQCLTSMTLAGGKVSTSVYGSILYDHTCRPFSTLSQIRQDGFYSPGVICPAGQYQACTSAVLANGQPSPITGSSFSFAFALEPEETAIGCCPASFRCSGTNACVSTASTGAVLRLTECAGPDLTSTSSFQYTVASPNPTFVVEAPLAQIVYKSSDIQFITVQHPTVTVTSNADGRLSTGDKAGIGVGVTAIVLIAIAAGLAWLFFRKRRSRVTPQEYPQGPASQNMYTEYPKHAGYYSDRGAPKNEIDGIGTNELIGVHGTSELPERAFRSELPGRINGTS